MLKIDHLSASYKTLDGNIHVVKDVDFEIFDNEIFGIAGESGCGKSTLLKTLYDIVEFPLEIDKGKVILSGEKNGQKFSFESGQIRKSWWNQISYVPQAAQSVLNPIVRLKDQFLDSIPKESKDETPAQTLSRVAKYMEGLASPPTCWTRSRSSCPAACARGRSSRWRPSCPPTWCWPTSPPPPWTWWCSAAY